MTSHQRLIAFVAAVLAAVIWGPTPPARAQSMGACCYFDGTCQMVSGPAACPTASALFLGACVSCDNWSCLVGCCRSNGSCVVLAISDCWALPDGNPLGSDGVCLPLSPCPAAVGPCCLPSGVCMVTTRVTCDGIGGLNGIWQGTGIACVGSTCPQPRGACCLVSICAFRTQATCTGRWSGAGTSCTPSERACCPADVNRSNTLSVQDIFDFLVKYFEQSTIADFNNSCTVTVQDLFSFLAAYFAGC